MPIRCLLFAFSTLIATPVFAGQPQEKPLTQDEHPMGWLIAIEKLRDMPRPGDIQNAGILANIGDIVETTPDQKKAIAESVKAYNDALLQKAAQWEKEMKTVRAEHEAKMLAALPEARREAAKKALEFSHEQWNTPLEFEARLRSQLLEKKAKAVDKDTPPEELDAAKKEFSTWIKTQRLKAREKNDAVVKSVKAMLDVKEAERLDSFDKNKEAPPAKK